MQYQSTETVRKHSLLRHRSRKGSPIVYAKVLRRIPRLKELEGLPTQAGLLVWDFSCPANIRTEFYCGGGWVVVVVVVVFFCCSGWSVVVVVLVSDSFTL